MIPTHPFGRTGRRSSRILLGSAAFWSCSQDEADRAMDNALGEGINHVDTAASYGDAELRIGDYIRRRGKPFFLATKTDQNTAAAARKQIHHSLKRLRVERLDLIQLHNKVDPAEWEVVFGPGGALEAVIEAREKGLARFIGITGHGLNAPAMHLRSLERFDFDSVLLPFSWLMAQNPAYLADFNLLLARCRERNVAVQTIKALVRSPWGEGAAHTYNTWYRPLEEQADVDLAVHYVLGHPAGLFINSAGDTRLLLKVISAAESYTSAPPEEALQAQAERLGMEALFK